MDLNSDDLELLNELFKPDEKYEHGVYIKGIQYADRKKLLQSKKENENKKGNDTDQHEAVATRVYERLRLRNAQLRELEEQARGYLVNDDLKAASDKQDEKEKGHLSSILNPLADFYAKISPDCKSEADKSKAINVGTRAYHLAVTDLFVEKAMTYLEDRAKEYKDKGEEMIKNGQRTYIFGTFVAFIFLAEGFVAPDFIQEYIPTIYKAAPTLLIEQSKTIVKTEKGVETTLKTIEKHEPNTGDSVSKFTKSFSILGMIVLVGVSLTRYGKVMLDQAERLFERRHALRQGRLYVHLNDGKLDIDELDKAFNWNVAGANSFSHLPTEAQAPWGTVFKEIGHKVPELMQSAIEALTGKRK